MSSALAIFFGLSLVSTVLAGVGWAMAYRLTPEDRQREALRWLSAWSLKGMVLPLALWGLMNVGLSWRLQAFMPQIQAAQNSGQPWFPELLKVWGVGAFLVTSYWSALTLVWVVINAGRGLQGEQRSDFKALCWTAFIGMLLPAAGIFWLGGWMTLGLAVGAMLVPVAGYAPSILHATKTAPMYARAIAKMKFGKYTEAEWEIIRELEKCEDDFDGWMMMADLYANHFHDLAEAERTVIEICNQPKTTSSELSVALHRLADWHLKLGGDPRGARRVLQMICDRASGTHLARMAQLRINQLPVSAEALREEQGPKSIHLPALGDSLDERQAAPFSRADRHQAAEQANTCVEKLKEDPNNVEAREKLARLFAERLDKAELGIEQLDLLLGMAGPDPARRAEWLGLVAAWQIKYRGDTEAGRRALERLVREFPETVQAFAARRRIELLERETAQSLRF